MSKTRPKIFTPLSSGKTLRMALLAMTFSLLFSGNAFAWDNPNKAAAPFITVKADKPSKIMLENRRVQSVDGDTFTYNTGRKILTIKADSLTVRQFIRDVENGRRSARATVTLTPQHRSIFNTEFKAR